MHQLKAKEISKLENTSIAAAIAGLESPGEFANQMDSGGCCSSDCSTVIVCYQEMAEKATAAAKDAIRATIAR